MSSKTKSFTPKQLARLPDAGYVLAFFLLPPLAKSVAGYAIMNGTCKYIHQDWGLKTGWCTLLWSCCPTRRQLAKPEAHVRYEHFTTHAAMIAAYPGLAPVFHVKAPNDIYNRGRSRHLGDQSMINANSPIMLHMLLQPGDACTCKNGVRVVQYDAAGCSMYRTMCSDPICRWPPTEIAERKPSKYALKVAARATSK